MAIRKIAKMGHPVLQRVAEPVADPTAPALERLVQDMIETMYDAPGTGLAAPQIYEPLRVVVYMVSPMRATAEDDGMDGVPLTVLINPMIEPVGTEMSEGWEGCLSVPGLRGLVPRYEHVRLTAQNLKGETFTRVASGFHARVIQHECDHLDGILYPQRMTDMRNLIFESEYRHLVAAAREQDADVA
jgi:peptide deformylase